MNNLLFFAEESGLLQQELGLVVLLFIAAFVAILVRYFQRIPYTTALVVVGLILTLVPDFLESDVDADFILAILVPPLLFEATLQIPWKKLKSDLSIILLLAVGGTFLGTIMVGAVVMQTLDIPLAAALAFGALISATDPVAVISFFRNMGVSKRLRILVEGESLFNDGAAIVLFNLALLMGVLGVGSFGPGAALQQFLIVSVGGLLVGLVLGYVVSSLILKNVDDHLIETTTTVALAFGAYVIAESFGNFVGIDGLHFSGILAVVAAGLMVGNVGLHNTSPTTRLTLERFWEFAAYLVNSIVFLMIGLEIELPQLLGFFVPIVVAVITVLISRAIIVYVIANLHNRLRPRRYIGLPIQHVMFWGGLRGAISLALALSLDGSVFGTDLALELRVMTFGVVLFTLLVQGSTMERLITHLRLAEKPASRLELQRRQARLYAKQAGRAELGRLREAGILYNNIWEAMHQVYNESIDRQMASLQRHLTDFPELEQELFLQARADVLRAEHSAVGDAWRRGLISQEVHDELIKELHDRLVAVEIIQENRGLNDDEGKKGG